MGGAVRAETSRAAQEAATRRRLRDAAMEHVTERLREDGFEGPLANALAGVIAPAALLVSRRVAYAEAVPGELDRFRADLAALLAPHREPRP